MDSVATLPAELTALAAVYQSLAPVAGKTEPIQETEIAQRLEAVRQLASDSQAMRVRLSNIQKRLNEIQLIEVQTQEKLERTQVLFHQVSLLVGSNPYLSQVAGQEPARLKQNLEMLAEELAQAQSGVIERKAKNITNLVSRTESMANQWLDALNEDIRLAVQELSASLAALDEIAALEEPAVDEGHRLLSAGPAMGTGDARQKASFTLNDLVGEMKRRSDYWQALEASSRALTDIQNPILEASQQVNQARQNVLDQLIEVSDWIKQTHGYPPTGENLSQERQELNRLDGQRTALKRQRLRAIALVSQLGNLASRYQSAGEKVRQITERIARKSEEFERLAAELADFTQTWQSHWNARRDNALASSEIRELLEEADRELETIRQQCRAGKMTYEAALQALRAIHTRVRAHQIALDETHLMNINGRIITFRGGAG